MQSDPTSVENVMPHFAYSRGLQIVYRGALGAPQNLDKCTVIHKFCLSYFQIICKVTNTPYVRMGTREVHGKIIIMCSKKLTVKSIGILTVSQAVNLESY